MQVDRAPIAASDVRTGAAPPVERPPGARPSDPTAPASLATPLAFSLSILVPAYNEAASIRSTVESLLSLRIPHGMHEVIVVDDGSTDHTLEILAGVAERVPKGRLRVLRQHRNMGKGAAVRRAFADAAGTHVLIFDADSEYDPRDIPALTAPIVSGRADVVYGVRLSGVNVAFPSLSHAVGNRLMTLAANFLFGAWMTDMHTCLKLFPAPLVQAMTLTEKGFGIDTELTTEMLRHGFRPYEVPVSYVGRTREEGKKVRLRDAVDCFEVMARVRMRGRRSPGKRDRRLAPRVTRGMVGVMGG
jgi:glycosyltransferase involved in cell wall biosynthesis